MIETCQAETDSAQEPEWKKKKKKKGGGENWTKKPIEDIS